jgi:predicted transporter
MNPHPIDPIALIAGLFFGLAGLAIFANQQWEDVDVTAFTAAGVMLIGLLLLGLVVTRFVQSTTTEADQDPPDV